MRITFGWRLDERQGPMLKGLVAQPYLGRLGLLGLLETHLGLTRPNVTKARRVAAYLGHLRRHDDGTRFYSKSLKVDEVGVAAKVLNWREDLLLAGWQGQFDENATARLNDISAVESSAAGVIPPGEAERLVLVADALNKMKIPIERITLLDHLERFPVLWRRVLNLLPSEPPVDFGRVAEGFLGELQRAAHESVTTGTAQRAVDGPGDGSVHVFQADSVEVAEQWLVARNRANSVDRLILAEQGGASLDDALRAAGAATLGFNEPSALRPALQTVMLALELLWSPLDPGRLLEFLLHPYGPFSHSARFKLARAYAAQPGIGGEEWTRAKAQIEEMTNGPALVVEVNYWLESDRWQRLDGAPLQAVRERVERVRDVLQMRFGLDGDDAPAVGAALAQCGSVLEGLSEMHSQTIQVLFPRQIEQLLAQSTTLGASNPLAYPEVGACLSATSPETCSAEHVAEVIWWMPSSPDLVQPGPWSEVETAALKRVGVEMKDLEQEMTMQARTWLRPLMAATQRFVMVLPPPDKEEHPFWQLIKRIAPDIQVQSVEAELEHASATVDASADVALPSLKASWQLPMPVVSRREQQSYTGLNEFFNNPAIAALKDAADLRTGTSPAVEERNRLYGTLAHRLVEKLFAQPDALTWPVGQLRSWSESALETLLEQEGMPLLMLGAGAILHRFRRISVDGICALIGYLRDANAVGVETEVELNGTLDTVPLTGKIDLVISLPSGTSAALDMKWSGESRYVKSLQDGQHLQLALYSSLLQENRGLSPSTLGYFIFDSKALVVTQSGVFPAARVVTPKNGLDVAAILAQARASWAWRQGQWSSGLIQVVDTRVADLSEFQGPDGTIAVSALGPWYSDYAPLLGWERT